MQGAVRKNILKLTFFNGLKVKNFGIFYSNICDFLLVFK